MANGALIIQVQVRVHPPRRILPPRLRNIPRLRRLPPTCTPHPPRPTRPIPPHRLPVQVRAPRNLARSRHPALRLRTHHMRLPRLLRAQRLPLTVVFLPVLLLSRPELSMMMGRPRTSHPCSTSLSLLVTWFSPPSPSCSLDWDPYTQRLFAHHHLTLSVTCLSSIVFSRTWAGSISGLKTFAYKDTVHVR
jgi:hypothetical protein